MGTDNGGWDGEEVELVSEFARVSVARDVGANGPRLRIRDARSGRVVFLDPLQLEALTWQDPTMFTEFFRTPFGPEDDDHT